jgi:hypothetical protein
LTTKNIAIIGSCVTRDAFTSECDLAVSFYRARTSVLSIYADPVPITDAELHNVSSNFLRKCFATDFRKTMFSELAESNSEAIVVDFVDERFDFYRNGPKIVSKTWDMYSAGLWKIAVAAGLKDCQKFEKHNYEMLLDLYSRFFKDLASIIGGRKIYINCALFCDTFINSEQKLCEFDDHIKEKNAKCNAMVYNIIATSFGVVPTDNIINVMNGIHADSRNKWSLAPFHYEEKYYSRFINALSKRVKNVHYK